MLGGDTAISLPQWLHRALVPTISQFEEALSAGRADVRAISQNGSTMRAPKLSNS
jgi:hypothetical protein